MTVASDVQDVTYATDGVTSEFTIPFYFLEAKHIVVDEIDNNGSVRTLVLGVDYSVWGDGNENGGFIYMAYAIQSGFKLHIYRSVPITQETEYQQNDPFPAKSTEKALDKLTMIAQQHASAIKNSIRYPYSEFTSDGELPGPGTRSRTILGFDEQGRQTLLPISSSVGAGDLRWELGSDNAPGFKAGIDFVPDVTTSFTLSRAPSGIANVWAYWDGIEQLDFTLNGNTLTFPTPVPTGVSVVRVRTGTTLSLNKPAQRSVGEDELVWGNLLERSCASVSEMAALDPVIYARAKPAGYYAPGDGGGDRSFVYDQTIPHASANGGTIIASTQASGCWVMVARDEPISVKHFGARVNGVSNDTTAYDAFVAATGISFDISPLSSTGALSTNIIAAQATLGDFSTASLNGGQFGGDISPFINGGFDVWSLGTSFTLGTHLQRLADGWNFDFNGSVGTMSASRLQISPSVYQPGFTPRYGIRVQCTVPGSGNTFMDLSTQVEGVRTFAGQKVTISFWAVSNSGSPVDLTAVKTEQFFGSGGAPSASVFNTSAPITIGTQWKRYSVTFDMASIAGKTLGTNADDSLDAILTLPLNRTFDITFANVMMNVGPIALPFPYQDLATIVRKCQRRIATSYDDSSPPGTVTSAGAIAFIASNATMVVPVKLPETMRTPPAVTFYNPATGALGTWDNQGTPVAASLNTNGIRNISIVVTGCGVGTVVNGHFVAQDPLI